MTNSRAAAIHLYDEGKWVNVSYTNRWPLFDCKFMALRRPKTAMW